ncbi:hypothetical protein E4U21_003076 [Claviceps maximensis]|nr:hypothetical protein E4U21_003076 [Claviceps maximensis]
MAFFPRTFYEDSSSFTPLFRLLDDFDSYSRQSGGSQLQQGSKRSGAGAFWQPKFDVRETGENYELHGELPGMNKDNVHIEFVDPQSLVVRGRAERSYTSGTPPAGLLEQSNDKAAITEGGEAAESSHKATVEDANEGQDQSEATETNKQQVEKADKKQQKQQHPDHGVKYWLSERSVGEFSRTFNFPSPVDQDAVSASFKDGILNILVPKAKKQGARRVAIN